MDTWIVILTSFFTSTAMSWYAARQATRRAQAVAKVEIAFWIGERDRWRAIAERATNQVQHVDHRFDRRNVN